MPKIVERLKRQLASQGNKNAKSMAIAILTKQGSLKNGELTAKGRERNSMTPAERAKDRQAKYSGRSPEDFNYNKKTNQATVKKSRRK